jgi:hypothetical protein
MIKSKTIFIVIITFLFYDVCIAQNQVINVIGTGIGTDVTSATNQALRNCIEKSMGTFLSSSTVVLNDSLVKDEIITIASGNIVSYEILSDVVTEEGHYVSLSAKISPEKLITSLKVKGYSFEINGGVYAQNILKDKFYAEQEIAALQTFITVWKKVQLFDFDIELIEPNSLKISQWRYNKKERIGLDKDGVMRLKDPFKKANETIVSVYKLNKITSNIAIEPPFRTDDLFYSGYSPAALDFRNWPVGNWPVNPAVEYSMNAIFTPKFTPNYFSFIKSLLNLLNSIAIKNLDSYKRLNSDYVQVNIATAQFDQNLKRIESSVFPFNTKYVETKKNKRKPDNGFDFSSYTKNENGNIVYYLRSPKSKNILKSLSDLVKFKSTALNFTSKSIEVLSSKPAILFDSNVSPNVKFCAPNFNRTLVIHPFYSDVIKGEKFWIDDFHETYREYVQTFRPTAMWILLTFEELQKLNNVEFTPKK